MSSNRFPNVDLINRSIRELYIRLSPSRVRQLSDDFELTTYDQDPKADLIIRTQRVARHLANHFRVAVSNIVVTFRSGLPMPGRIEISSSLDFFVELNSQHRSQPNAIAAILAHEVAHIFLHQAFIRFERTFANEVLTDTAAAYLGCGMTILRGASQTETKHGDMTETHTTHFGYVTVDELGYIQAKRDSLFGRTASPLLGKSFPQAGYSYKALVAGQGYVRAERNQRPYSKRTQMWPRFISRFTRKASGPSELDRKAPGPSGAFTFPCACCAQILRLPTLGKKLSVRCPICEATFVCYS